MSRKTWDLLGRLGLSFNYLVARILEICLLCRRLHHRRRSLNRANRFSWTTLKSLFTTSNAGRFSWREDAIILGCQLFLRRLIFYALFPRVVCLIHNIFDLHIVDNRTRWAFCTALWRDGELFWLWRPWKFRDCLNRMLLGCWAFVLSCIGWLGCRPRLFFWDFLLLYLFCFNFSCWIYKYKCIGYLLIILVTYSCFILMVVTK